MSPVQWSVSIRADDTTRRNRQSTCKLGLGLGEITSVLVIGACRSMNENNYHKFLYTFPRTIERKRDKGFFLSSINPVLPQISIIDAYTTAKIRFTLSHAIGSIGNKLFPLFLALVKQNVFALYFR